MADNLRYEDDIDESLWSSPMKDTRQATPSMERPVSSGKRAAQSVATGTISKEEHEASLRQELVHVRNVNEAIEGVLTSLEKAKRNMNNVNQTVSSASSLLNIWTRILSQTEHNQRLILDPAWQGASQDISDIQGEAVAKQQAAERREAEEQERRNAAARKAEEDEKRRTEAAATPAAKPRSGPRGRARGHTTARTAYSTASSANTSTASISRGIGGSRRTTSGIGRVSSTRGTRGRGST